MIKEFLQNLFSSERRTNQEESHRQEKLSPVMSDGKHDSAVRPTSSYDRDIRALQKKYGTLKSGMSISMSLQDALTVMPRSRRKSDAYNGLKKELMKSYGVDFNVSSKPAPYKEK